MVGVPDHDGLLRDLDIFDLLGLDPTVRVDDNTWNIALLRATRLLDGDQPLRPPDFHYTQQHVDAVCDWLFDERDVDERGVLRSEGIRGRLDVLYREGPNGYGSTWNPMGDRPGMLARLTWTDDALTRPVPGRPARTDAARQDEDVVITGRVRRASSDDLEMLGSAKRDEGDDVLYIGSRPKRRRRERAAGNSAAVGARDGKRKRRREDTSVSEDDRGHAPEPAGKRRRTDRVVPAQDDRGDGNVPVTPGPVDEMTPRETIELPDDDDTYEPAETGASLRTLIVRAGDPAGRRFALALVPREDGAGNPTGPPVLMVTAGVDDNARVSFHVTARDRHGERVYGRRIAKPISWDNLAARGAVFIGRFRGASRQVIEEFAVELAINPFASRSRLPLANRSPTRY